MFRFAAALAAYAMRLIVPIAIGATSVGAALFLILFPIHDVPRFPETGSVCIRSDGGTCLIPYRGPDARQISAGILIGVVGLGLAVLIALWNRRHPRPRPVPRVSRGWQAGAAYAARKASPFVMTVVAVVGAGFLGVAPLNHGGYPPRFGWQTPAAVLIGVIGLGLAFGIAVWNRWHPQARPLPPLPAGWHSGA
jgi:hypothetical protein